MILCYTYYGDNMKGNGLKGGYLVSLIILCVGLLIMLILLKYAKSIKKASVTELNYSTTSTSTKYEDITTDVLPDIVKENNENLDVKNFSSSLADILYYNPLIGNYKLELVYKDAKFNFTCGEYDSNTGNCTSGSATMNTGKTILPLYTYDNENNDYTKRLSDYYIIVSDEYIILTYNYVGKTPGVIKIYNKTGDFKGEIKNVITGYYDNGQLLNQLYPNVKDGNIYYYICHNNSAKINAVSLSNTKTIIYEELIPNSRCY